MSLPTVQIVVEDNGVNTTLQLPLANIQLVLGGALGGVNYQPVATTNPATLSSTFVGGPMAEAAGLVCAAGGVVIAMRVPITTPGTAKTPFTSGTGTGLASVSVTLDGTYGAFDEYYVAFRCVHGGTLTASGTSGITFQISLDAGRNWSPVITLATNALTYAIPGTGVTIVLGTAAETYVVGDLIQFQTVAPIWATGGVQNALAAFAASQYALAGVGSVHLVGVCAAGDVATFQGYMDALGTQFIYNRMLTTARDANSPTAWGGAGETEATWMASLATAFSATSAKRMLVGGGYYNMPSAFPNSTYGTVFSYRRPLTWADAVRRVQVPLQRRGGRVRDGALTNIVVNPASDPTDGFIYHDERVNPGLDAARFLSAITWPKKQGFFVCHENLMSPIGSQFTDLTLGNVIDEACSIGYQEGVEEISDDLRLNQNGTLYAPDALNIQNTIQAGLDTNMTNQAMISSATVSVVQTANVGLTGNIPVNISVLPRGYVNSITETIGLQVPNAAPAGG